MRKLALRVAIDILIQPRSSYCICVDQVMYPVIQQI